MIVPNISQNAVAVADHYDELDPIYRRVWGDHVHHGLWATGRETPEEAVEARVDTVGDRLVLTPGQACVDIGCVKAAWAIESNEHMVDKPLFFAEAHRVLVPGGRFVICAWLALG